MKPFHAVVRVGLGAIVAVSLGSLGCSAAAPEDASGESATGSSEGALLAGPQLTETAVADLLRTAGFEESLVAKMVCTAKYESGFYEKASHKNSNGTVDYGLWQINSIHLGSRGCASSGTAAYTGSVNARCAKDIFDEQGIDAWYAYQSHKATCDAFTLPTDPSGDDDDDGSGGSGGSSGGGTSEGSCWSATLGETVPALTCVQSSYDLVEEQCIDGEWYSGVKNGVGPAGACSSEQ